MSKYKVLSERKYKAGYIVREELIGNYADGSGDIKMKSAYTPNGDYIGDPKTAYFLVVKKGITPEKSKPQHNVCSIGFSAKENKWYGWSHRAIYGFGIGDVVKKGDCIAGYLPIGFKAKTMAGAKEMAIAFAESVS